MKTIKQYLLYVLNNKELQASKGNWNIEYYNLWHDLQDRAMALEIQKIPFKIVIEYTDKTKEELHNF